MFRCYKKTAFVIASQEIHVTSGRSATLWKSKHQVFSKKETIIEGLIKVCFTFVRAAQISVTSSHFIISIFFTVSFFVLISRNTSIFEACYRLRDSSAAGAGTEGTIFFFPPLSPFLDHVRVIFKLVSSFILPTSLLWDPTQYTREFNMDDWKQA